MQHKKNHKNPEKVLMFDKYMLLYFLHLYEYPQIYLLP
jgi:hypothetical protein